MNKLKKILFHSLLLAMVSANVVCMDGDTHSNQNSQRLMRLGADIWDMSDYLTQLCSINFIDSTDATVVTRLAKIRSLLSASCVLASTLRLFCTNTDIIYAHPETILDIVRAYMRGNNTLKDYKVWNNSASLSYTNARQMSDKNLDNKKLCQYAWLSLNKVLPALMNHLLGYECYPNYLMLAKVSELYRQKLMYAMIENR